MHPLAPGLIDGALRQPSASADAMVRVGEVGAAPQAASPTAAATHTNGLASRIRAQLGDTCTTSLLPDSEIHS